MDSNSSSNEQQHLHYFIEDASNESSSNSISCLNFPPMLNQLEKSELMPFKKKIIETPQVLLLPKNNEKIILCQNKIPKKSYSLITDSEKDEFLKFTECNICLAQAEKPVSCPQCQLVACEKCMKTYFKKYGGETVPCPTCKKEISFNQLISNNMVSQIQEILKVTKDKYQIQNEIQDLMSSYIDLINKSLSINDKNIKQCLEYNEVIQNYYNSFCNYINSLLLEFNKKSIQAIKENDNKRQMALKNFTDLVNVRGKLSELKNKSGKKSRDTNQDIKDLIETSFLSFKRISSNPDLFNNNYSSTNHSQKIQKRDSGISNASNSTINSELLFDLGAFGKAASSKKKQKFVETTMIYFNSKKVNFPLIQDPTEEIKPKEKNKIKVYLGNVFQSGNFEISYEETNNNIISLDEKFEEKRKILCKLTLEKFAPKKKWFVSMAVTNDIFEKKYELQMEENRKTFSRVIPEDELFGEDENLKNNSLVNFEIYGFNVS